MSPFKSILSLALLLIAAVSMLQVVEAARASASHILVKTEKQAIDLKNRIVDDGENFEDLAKEHSTCPSGKRGGSLGSFGPGQMVKEFDHVVFNDEVGVVHGPVKTQFGYHLILISDRED